MKPETVELLLKIISDRANWWAKRNDYATAGTYGTVLDMLMYALDDNIECLRQFDYYGEEIL